MRFSRLPRWLTAAPLLAATWLSSSVASAETLSADEAVRVASKNNPSLKAALLDADAARLAVRAEENGRTPSLLVSTNGQYSESFGGGAGGLARTDGAGVNGSTSITYTTDIGTQLSGGLESSVNWHDIETDPTYSADIYFSARQPLLKGGGSDVVLAPLAQARAGQTQAERERDQTASATALAVLSAYWELWYADQSVKVQESALAGANKQLADAKLKQEKLGTASKVDVLQFATQVAQLKDALSQARATRTSRAIALGQLLGMSPEKAIALSPTDEIPTAGKAPSVAKLKESFERRSSELAALRAQIEAGQSRVIVADDADQPRLDVFGKVAAGGMWTSDELTGLSLPGSRPAFTVYAGLELELPLGESRASADAARARTQLDATKTRYQARVDAIAAEIATLDAELAAAKEQVELASATAEMAKELALAEQEKLALGTASSSDVVKADQTAREAELRRLRAVVDQADKQFQLEHDAGALLDRYGAKGGAAS